MFKLVLIFGCAVFVGALPCQKIQDESGQEYYLLPLQAIEESLHSRVRRSCKCTESHDDSTSGRETSFNVKQLGGEVSHTFVNNADHFAKGTVWGERDSLKTPLTTGQKFEYAHKPTQSELTVAAQNTRGWGDDISAKGTYNFLQTADGKGRIGAYGEYNRHLGGPIGTQDPQWNVGIQGSLDLP